MVKYCTTLYDVVYGKRRENHLPPTIQQKRVKPDAWATVTRCRHAPVAKHSIAWIQLRCLCQEAALMSFAPHDNAKQMQQTPLPKLCCDRFCFGVSFNTKPYPARSCEIQWFIMNWYSPWIAESHGITMNHGFLYLAKCSTCFWVAGGFIFGGLAPLVKE